MLFIINFIPQILKFASVEMYVQSGYYYYYYFYLTQCDYSGQSHFARCMYDNHNTSCPWSL